MENTCNGNIPELFNKFEKKAGMTGNCLDRRKNLGNLQYGRL